MRGKNAFLLSEDRNQKYFLGASKSAPSTIRRACKPAGGSAKPKFSLLALPISRSPCEISQALATSDQDGSSPRRAARGDRGTAREFLRAGCGSAAPEMCRISEIFLPSRLPVCSC